MSSPDGALVPSMADVDAILRRTAVAVEGGDTEEPVLTSLSTVVAEASELRARGKHGDPKARDYPAPFRNWSAEEVEAHARKLKDTHFGVEIKDCWVYLQKYPNCFMGNEAVDWLERVAFNDTTGASRKAAVAFAQHLQQCGVFVPVTEGNMISGEDGVFQFLDEPTSVMWMKVDRARKERDIARARNAEVLASLETARAEAEKYKADAERLQLEGERLRCSIIVADEAKAMMETETQALRAQVDTLTSTSQQQEEHIASLTAQLSEAQATADKLPGVQLTVRELERLERDLVARVKALEAEMEGATSRATEEADAHAAAVASLTLTIEELNNALAAEQAERHKAEASISALNDAFVSSSSEVEVKLASVTGELEESERQRNKLKADALMKFNEMIALKTEKTKLAADRDALATLLEKLQREQENILADSQAAKHGATAVMAEKSAMEESMEAQRERQAEAEAMVAVLKQALKDAEAETRELEDLLTLRAGELQVKVAEVKELGTRSLELKGKVIEQEEMIRVLQETTRGQGSYIQQNTKEQKQKQEGQLRAQIAAEVQIALAEERSKFEVEKATFAAACSKEIQRVSTLYEGKVHALQETVAQLKEGVSTEQEDASDTRPNRNCPNGHAASPFTTADPGYNCDVCQRTGIPKGTEMFGCRRCDWDACLVCATTTLVHPGRPGPRARGYFDKMKLGSTIRSMLKTAEEMAGKTWAPVESDNDVIVSMLEVAGTRPALKASAVVACPSPLLIIQAFTGAEHVVRWHPRVQACETLETLPDLQAEILRSRVRLEVEDEEFIVPVVELQSSRRVRAEGRYLTVSSALLSEYPPTSQEGFSYLRGCIVDSLPASPEGEDRWRVTVIDHVDYRLPLRQAREEERLRPGLYIAMFRALREYVAEAAPTWKDPEPEASAPQPQPTASISAAAASFLGTAFRSMTGATTTAAAPTLSPSGAVPNSSATRFRAPSWDEAQHQRPEGS